MNRHRVALQDLAFISAILLVMSVVALDWHLHRNEDVPITRAQAIELDEALTLGGILLAGLLIFAARRYREQKQQTLRTIAALRRTRELKEEAKSARARAEEISRALGESETQILLLMESALDAVFAHADDRMCFVNQSACRLFRADSSEQLLGTSFLDRVHPASRDLVQARTFKVLVEKKAVPPREATYVCLDGSPISVEVTALPFTFKGEAAVLVFARDITERKASQEALKRSEQRYSSLLEASPDAVVVVNGAEQIVLVNTRTEQMFGHSRAELLGQKMARLFPERFRNGQSWSQASYVSDEKAQIMDAPAELFGLRGDGTEFPIEVGLNPLETEEGGLVFCAIRDITERKTVEARNRQLEIAAAEAEAANRAKSLFLSTMSHEIRTPMNAIMGYSQLMLRDSHLGADAKVNLKIINRSGEHLLHIINEVLDMAKIESGRLQFTPITFNLRSLVSDLEAMFQLQAEAKALEFGVRVSGERVEYVLADEGKIRQILINLLGNAIKFTVRGRIDLSVSLNYRANGRLWISAAVEDTGIGLSAEDQSGLFHPLVCGRGGQQVQHGGTGLGLAISRGLANGMGGDISVRSTLGSGSTFTFEVPVERGAGRDFHGRQAQSRRVRGIENVPAPPRILIVDDLQDNREWLNQLLISLGFAVRTAENGEAALRAWGEWNPQLILMDVHMPLLDGLEASRLIRSRPKGKETKIIALTADATEMHRQTVLESSVNDFISKPCHENELLEKIRAHLGLTYIYDEETCIDAAGSPRKVKSDELSGEQMQKLPPDLIRRLRGATRSGDKGLLDQLIATIEEQGGAQCAGNFRELANNYQYDTLIWLLENACS